jgi:hypothetical protein
MGPQRVIEAVDVQQAERLGVQAELRPRPDLEELLQRAEASGEREERVRQTPGTGRSLDNVGWG